MPRELDSVRSPVAQFALAGIVVLTVFGVAAVLVLRSLANDEALRDARQFAELAGQGIVEPTVVASLLDDDPAAVEAVDRAVNERVLGDRVVRVKLWTADGRVVYSDEPRLIGSRLPLDDAKREVLRTGSTRAELSDLSGPENRFERGHGDLYEVYLPIRAPDGTPLLFETYQRQGAVAATGRRIWLPFAALLLGSLLLLWLVQVPLAWRLGRRLQRTQEEREALLLRAVEASVDERRRIAADLHDGPVQDLAGISYSLSAAAETETSPEKRRMLRDAAAGTRDAMRRLRTLLVEIHPPNLRASGLEAALADLLAPFRADGLETDLSVAPDAELGEAEERLVYRAAAEALRNVDRHAHATRVAVAVRPTGGTVRLDVVDDGVGFTTQQREQRRDDGHVGLSLLEELAARAGATVEVRSTPGAGTTFALEVPRR
jgi:signal transduction histidine kinase